MDSALADPSAFATLGRRIASPFFTADVARLAIRTGAEVVNFLGFNPFNDQETGKRNRDNVPRYAELGPPLDEALDLLAERLTDPKLSKYVTGVREEVRNGALLSDAFASQKIFPAIYVTTVLAGERSGSLPEVLERYVTYQKLALSVRKKLLVSLMYPALLVFLVVCLIVFLITYVVPNFAQLYSSMQAQLPTPTQILIAVGTTARGYVLGGVAALIAGIVALRFWIRTPAGNEAADRFLMPFLMNLTVFSAIGARERQVGDATFVVEQDIALRGLPQMQHVPALDQGAQGIVERLQAREEFANETIKTGTMVSGLIIFQTILLCLMGSNNGAREIAGERALYEKERMSGLRPAAYAVAKLAFAALLGAAQGAWMTVFVKLICERS